MPPSAARRYCVIDGHCVPAPQAVGAHWLTVTVVVWIGMLYVQQDALLPHAEQVLPKESTVQ
jgi:hypothetical protein